MTAYTGTSGSSAAETSYNGEVLEHRPPDGHDYLCGALALSVVAVTSVASSIYAQRSERDWF